MALTCVEAVTAVNRTIVRGFEGYHGLFAAFCAGCGEHFALRTFGLLDAHALFASLTASGATTGFVGKAFFSVKFLLGSGEYEFLATLAAG